MYLSSVVNVPLISHYVMGYFDIKNVLKYCFYFLKIICKSQDKLKRKYCKKILKEDIWNSTKKKRRMITAIKWFLYTEVLNRLDLFSWRKKLLLLQAEGKAKGEMVLM